MTIRLAVLGAGGLGKGIARMAQRRHGFQLVAIADSNGYCYDPAGLNVSELTSLPQVSLLESAQVCKSSDHAILNLMQSHGEDFDAIFMALPNLPVSFYADTLKMILEKSRFQGVFVDALKRTKAVESLLPLHPLLVEKSCLYITGAGATPGFLTTVAAVAAQSFVEVLSVDIHFGVGISHWEAYKATIREDFLHLEGFDAARVSRMTDAEIEAELDARNGLLALRNMEHADDIILELAGICPRDRVTVGGLVDTRHAKKPVSTTVTVTGRTCAGAVGSHQFIVSDEATMVDNVCGPALGFLSRGFDYQQRGIYGMMTSAELMPKFGPSLYEDAPVREHVLAAIMA